MHFDWLRWLEACGLRLEIHFSRFLFHDLDDLGLDQFSQFVVVGLVEELEIENLLEKFPEYSGSPLRKRLGRVLSLLLPH